LRQVMPTYERRKRRSMRCRRWARDSGQTVKGRCPAWPARTPPSSPDQTTDQSSPAIGGKNDSETTPGIVHGWLFRPFYFMASSPECLRLQPKPTESRVHGLPITPLDACETCTHRWGDRVAGIGCLGKALDLGSRQATVRHIPNSLIRLIQLKPTGLTLKVA
jgi:hypothetical protein